MALANVQNKEKHGKLKFSPKCKKVQIVLNIMGLSFGNSNREKKKKKKKTEALSENDMQSSCARFGMKWFMTGLKGNKKW